MRRRKLLLSELGGLPHSLEVVLSVEEANNFAVSEDTSGLFEISLLSSTSAVVRAVTDSVLQFLISFFLSDWSVGCGASSCFAGVMKVLFDASLIFLV